MQFTGHEIDCDNEEFRLRASSGTGFAPLKRQEGEAMETIIEIIHHSDHLKPVLRVEVFSYVLILFIVVSLGIFHSYMRRL